MSAQLELESLPLAKDIIPERRSTRLVSKDEPKIELVTPSVQKSDESDKDLDRPRSNKKITHKSVAQEETENDVENKKENHEPESDVKRTPRSNTVEPSKTPRSNKKITNKSVAQEETENNVEDQKENHETESNVRKTPRSYRAELSRTPRSNKKADISSHQETKKLNLNESESDIIVPHVSDEETEEKKITNENFENFFISETENKTRVTKDEPVKPLEKENKSMIEESCLVSTDDEDANQLEVANVQEKISKVQPLTNLSGSICETPPISNEVIKTPKSTKKNSVSTPNNLSAKPDNSPKSTTADTTETEEIEVF
jgi:hypothetical protein